MAEMILLCDADDTTRRFVAANLRLSDFDVVATANGRLAREEIARARPDLLIVALGTPEDDALELCRRVRADPCTMHTPIIVVSRRSRTAEEMVGALDAGADDVVVGPFEPAELVARVEKCLYRARDLRGASPLTGLPGNPSVEAELVRRLTSSEPVALVYADLNDFKSFNDRYGFLRGDEMILLLADVLQRGAAQHAGRGAFVGHIGGDDFMVVCAPEDVRALCERVVTEFDARAPGLYDPVDRERGWVVTVDRRGNRDRVPLVSVSLGVATDERRSFADHRALVEVATEMKTYLKQGRRHSAYAIDVRTDEEEVSSPAPLHPPVALSVNGGS